jgi:anthranilate synthase component II
MILIIDNYDSFTYNLYQYIGTFYPDIKVVRNDKITIAQIEEMNPDKILLSPGPKRPEDAGICIETIKFFHDKKPILGICLGHQCIAATFGGVVTYAKEILHGKQSVIEHDGSSIFKGIPSPIKIARYHSLAVAEEKLPDCLKVLARTEDGEIMAMKHKEYPVVGLQFHPESIYTDYGKRFVENFVNSEI